MFFRVHNVENFELLKNSLFSRTLIIKISEYQISIAVRPRLTGFQLSNWGTVFGRGQPKYR